MNAAIRLFVAALSLLALIGPVHAQSGNDWVQFKIVPIEGSRPDGTELAWLATHGPSAKFIVTMKVAAPKPGSHFSFSSGSIQHVDGSNATTLLQELVTALGAKTRTTSAKKVRALRFDVAVLGTNQSRVSRDGGFTDTPRGPWLVTKIFLADGAGEVYLNLNPRDGTGEFSLKDEDYGDIVLRELASVL